ncbi:YdbL family protein [Desulfosarcina sp.]|uniref:YdbL family protein n=1 Tax=Desulfosarcina sp. TaxID=2027861 RepID=UPI003970F027
MNRTRHLCFAATVVAGILLFWASAYCSDIKARMKDRLPRIIELKAAGIIGENNQGLLAFVGADQQAQTLVDAENKDRQLVYGAIAKQQGTAVEIVAQRRALQIAENAKPGEWLQDAGGKWYQK